MNMVNLCESTKQGESGMMGLVRKTIWILLNNSHKSLHQSWSFHMAANWSAG